jgi:hypothetical protein
MKSWVEVVPVAPSVPAFEVKVTLRMSIEEFEDFSTTLIEGVSLQNNCNVGGASEDMKSLAIDLSTEYRVISFNEKQLKKQKINS